MILFLQRDEKRQIDCSPPISQEKQRRLSAHSDIHTERINLPKGCNCTIHPPIYLSAHNIPQEEASAVNEESAR